MTRTISWRNRLEPGVMRCFLWIDPKLVKVLAVEPLIVAAKYQANRLLTCRRPRLIAEENYSAAPLDSACSPMIDSWASCPDGPKDVLRKARLIQKIKDTKRGWNGRWKSNEFSTRLDVGQSGKGRISMGQ